MSIPDGQCCSSPSLSHLCFSSPVDTGHAPCWAQARAVVSCIFHVPNESCLRRGECIAEGTISVCTGLLSATLLLIAVFSCGSELPTWILSSFSLVLAVIFKADQVNFLGRSFPSQWHECAASSEFRAVTLCCPDCRHLRETQLRSSGCVWDLQKIEIHLTS